MKGLATAAGVLALLAVVLIAVVLLRWQRTFDAPLPDIHASNDPAVIAQGRYIAYGPGHCVGCHTDDSVRGLVASGGQPPLSGGNEFRLPFGRIFTPNLTPDPQHGIGKLTDAQLARMIRYGVRHDGRAALPFMDFHELSDDDLRAVISFLRSQPPVAKAVPQHDVNLVGKALLAFVIKPVGPKEPPRQKSPAQEATIERGKYLANSVAACAGCHTKRNPLTGLYTAAKFSGGFTMASGVDPQMMFVTPNLTPDPKTGRITQWDEEQFVGRFGAGIGLPGTHMPWKQFQSMSETDLRAIYRYLRSLEPVENATGASLQRRKG